MAPAARRLATREKDISGAEGRAPSNSMERASREALTAAVPAHSRSVVILSSTDGRPLSPALHNRTGAQTLAGSGKKTRPDPEGQDALRMYRSTSDQRVDLGVFWKPAKLFFREDEFPVDGDFENAGHPFDELGLFRASFHQSCPRTEGSWFVVSGHAVFDSYLHCRHL